ncbi:MAG: hypothetical protein IPL12_04205 [Bacteroidetes bacterium]|nr:hypothetical protein [Bacteroidota bacterium]
MESIIGIIITALAIGGIGAVIALANKASASAPLKTEAGDDLFKIPNVPVFRFYFDCAHINYDRPKYTGL